jgi:hypothetical protein
MGAKGAAVDAADGGSACPCMWSRVDFSGRIEKATLSQKSWQFELAADPPWSAWSAP